MEKKKFFIISLIAFLSGSCFLIFEVSWFRIMSLISGATVTASTLVISAFMLGLGIGAILSSKIKQMIVNPLRAYGVIMLALSIYGFFSHNLFFSIVHFTAGFSTATMYFIAFLLLFLPALLMGSLVPALSHAAVNDSGKIGLGIGNVYAWETLGSVVGSLICSFVLIRYMGQHNTIIAASILIAIVGLVSIFYNFSLPALPLEEVKAKEPKQHFFGFSTKNLPILAVFITGMIISGLQIIWFRFFKTYMVNTGYTFALIASIVIFGLFIGGRIYTQKYSDKTINPAILLYLLGWMCVSIIVGLVLLLTIQYWLLKPLGNLNALNSVRIYVIPAIVSFLVIIPPTIISGFIFPASGALYSYKGDKINSDMGRIMLFNSVGSSLGPVIAAFLFIPWMGSSLSILVFVLLLLTIIIVASLKIKTKAWFKAALYLSTLTVLIVALSKPNMQILPPSFLLQSKQILYYKEYTEGILVVGKERDGNREVLSTYVNNSAVIGSNYDAIKVVKMVGHIPFMAGLKCENAMVVGFGMGVTTSAIASHSEVKSIDCVELVKGLTKTAHYYDGLNHNVILDPRLKVMEGDGRYFLQKTNKKYDLISSDPTHPLLGSGNLYTKEYFELCKERLNDGGMVSQYLPLHKLRLQDLLGIIKTFHAVFPNATVWMGHYHAVLLGQKSNNKIDFITWQRVTSTINDMYLYTEPYHIAASLIQNSESINRFDKNIQINTDDRSYVEFFHLSSFDDSNTPNNLEYLNKNRANVFETFVSIPDTARMKEFYKGNVLLNEALVGMLNNDRRLLRDKLTEAVMQNPNSEEYPFLLKFYFPQGQ